LDICKFIIPNSKKIFILFTYYLVKMNW